MFKFVEVKADDSNPAASVGVQSWSRGAIFPAVISVVEEYDSPMPLGDFIAHNHQIANHRLIHSFYRNYLANFFERSLDERIISRQYVLSLAGWLDAAFASYDEAHAEAIERLNYVEELSPAQVEAADRLARRSYFSYSPEQVAQGEMAGGSRVFNRIGLIARVQ